MAAVCVGMRRPAFSLRVRNTFIETSAECSSPLRSEASCHRRVQSCPASKLGLLLGERFVREDVADARALSSRGTECSDSDSDSIGSYPSMDSTGAPSVHHIHSLGEKQLVAESCQSDFDEPCWTPKVECSSTPTMDDVPIFDFFFESPSTEPFVDLTQWVSPECMDFAASWLPAVDSMDFTSHWASGADASALVPNTFGCTLVDEVAPMCPQGPLMNCLEPPRTPRMVLSLADALEATDLGEPLPLETQPAVEVSHLDSVAESVAPPAPPATPAPGSVSLPSVGSSGHQSGRCSPCAFFHAAGCANGVVCQFCHLCPPQERKRRRKAQLADRKAAAKLRSVEEKAS